MIERPNEKFELFKYQYSTARDELLKRLEIQQKVIEMTITAATALLGIALAKNELAAVALLYPPIAACLAINWYKVEVRILWLKDYINENIERNKEYELPIIGWVEYSRKRNLNSFDKWFYSNTVSHGFIFIFTQSMAVIIGLIGSHWTLNQNPLSSEMDLITFLLLIDTLSLLIVLNMIKDRTKRKIKGVLRPIIKRANLCTRLKMMYNQNPRPTLTNMADQLGYSRCDVKKTIELLKEKGELFRD